MQPSHPSDPIGLIIRGVADIPGCSDVSVTARRFPRFLPAEPGTGYLEQTLSFAVGAVPDQVALPPDADEVTLTLSGALAPHQQTKGDLLVALQAMFESIGVADEWSATAHVDGAGSLDRPANPASIGGPDAAASLTYHVLISRDRCDRGDA